MTLKQLGLLSAERTLTDALSHAASGYPRLPLEIRSTVKSCADAINVLRLDEIAEPLLSQLPRDLGLQLLEVAAENCGAGDQGGRNNSRFVAKTLVYLALTRGCVSVVLGDELAMDAASRVDLLELILLHGDLERLRSVSLAGFVSARYVGGREMELVATILTKFSNLTEVKLNRVANKELLGLLARHVHGLTHLDVSHSRDVADEEAVDALTGAKFLYVKGPLKAWRKAEEGQEVCVFRERLCFIDLTDTALAGSPQKLLVAKERLRSVFPRLGPEAAILVKK